MSSSKHGCVFLLDIWDQLGTVLEAVGDWTDPQKALAYDLLGTHPALPPAVACTSLKALTPGPI